MRDWQSEREDYLAGGESGGNNCLFLFMFLLFSVLVSWLVLYLSIINQLSK